MRFEPVDEVPAPRRKRRPPSVPRDTSEAAAESMRSHTARLRDDVYHYIESTGMTGATEGDIRLALELSGDTVRPRVWELIKEGRIIDSGARRKTRSGRSARVLVSL